MTYLTEKRLEAYNLYTHRFSGPPEIYLRFLFSDRTYNARSPLTVLKAHFLEKLSGRNNSLHRIVLDVVSELREIVQKERGEISHIVLYGKNRTRVLAYIVCCGGIPQSIPIVLSKKEIEKDRFNTHHGKQTCPYQIDTGRFPFLYKF